MFVTVIGVGAHPPMVPPGCGACHLVRVESCWGCVCVGGGGGGGGGGMGWGPVGDALGQKGFLGRVCQPPPPLHALFYIPHSIFPLPTLSHPQKGRGGETGAGGSVGWWRRV